MPHFVSTCGLLLLVLADGVSMDPLTLLLLARPSPDLNCISFTPPEAKRKSVGTTEERMGAIGASEQDVDQWMCNRVQLG